MQYSYHGELRTEEIPGELYKIYRSTREKLSGMPFYTIFA